MYALISILDLARFQFAQTTIFHFFFVALSIGMAFTTAVFETLYVVKKDVMYKKITQFWGKIFLLSFAVGVVTGIVQEFQFGMNWSAYSRYVGDIFGAPLAVEALVAFFAESTFIGLWMFTWDRFKPAVHALFIWIVSLGTMMSAMWILAANAFMQNPVAYQINHKIGRAELKSFGGLLTNEQLWYELPHVLFGALITGAVAVMGMSAWRLLKAKKASDIKFFRQSLKVTAIIAIIGSIGTGTSGDLNMSYLETDQPMKYSSMEANIVDSGTKDGKTSQAWAIMAWTGYDKNGKPVDKGRVEVPVVQSLLAHHKTTGYNKGVLTMEKELGKKYPNALNKDIKNFYPPINTVFYSFRVMAGGAGVILLVAIVALILNRKDGKRLLKQRWFLWLMVVMTFLPFIVNSAGWIITEMGRMPWTVYGLFTVADSVSPNVSVNSLLITNVLYFATFTLLGGVMIYFSIRSLNSDIDDIAYDVIGSEKTSTRATEKVAKGGRA